MRRATPQLTTGPTAASAATVEQQVPALIREFIDYDVVKKENARLDQLDEDKGRSETDGWRIGDLIRKGKKKDEKIGVVIQVVSKTDEGQLDERGESCYGFAYIWVLWEDGTTDAPGRGKKDIHNFRNAYMQTYKNGLGERSLDITEDQLIAAWCATTARPFPPFPRGASGCCHE